MITANVGQRIRDTRKAAGVSGYELARRCEISRGYLHEVERGNSIPSANIVLKIASALTVSPNRLMGYADDEGGLSDTEINLITAYRERNYSYILTLIAELLKVN